MPTPIPQYVPAKPKSPLISAKKKFRFWDKANGELVGNWEATLESEGGEEVTVAGVVVEETLEFWFKELCRETVGKGCWFVIMDEVATPFRDSRLHQWQPLVEFAYQ